MYKFTFNLDQQSDSKRELVAGEGCEGPLNQTAYRTAKTTISCGKKGITPESRVKFFCKENGPICEDILSTKSALRSNGTFTLTETESGFTVSISNVSTQHAGAALRKIQLEVKVKPTPTFPVSSMTTAFASRDCPDSFIPGIICVAALQLLLFVVVGVLLIKCFTSNI
ncbi:hypothetical protein OYC64_011738 [Pagothenia borchgrevinki]|uniref:Uncharacterized protein n=1 Tax=Pagothenia borchgrevinki TaxID=8213 RepID=A0ABD2FHB4_PAGBO